MAEHKVCTYKCPWPRCGHEFSRVVGYGYTNKDVNQSRGADTVTCPMCKNNLKTWDDAITMKKIKEEQVKWYRKQLT